MVGSCNGLICLRDSDNRDVSLWNLATKQFKILPKSSVTFEDDCLVAFGFDAETQDYKVVLVSVVRLVAPISCGCRVEVYSLSTNCWRLLDGIYFLPGDPFPYPDYYSGLYLNGRLFFVANFILSDDKQCIPLDNNDRLIISFDLSKEMFINSYPASGSYSTAAVVFILLALFAVASGRFAKVDGVVLKDDDPTGYYEDFHIWVLNEHGFSSGGGISVKNKYWKKLYRFRVDVEQGNEYIPRGISNDGEFALLEPRSVHGVGRKKMVLYSLVTHEVRKKFLYCDQVMSNAYAFKPIKSSFNHI